MYIIKNNFNNFKNVRLIDINNKQIGIFTIEEAIKKSKLLNLDLVMINDKISPPICKIINFNKFIYKKNKYLKELKKNNKINKNFKEIQINQNIENKDYNIKINKIKKLILKKNKVKITIKFKGREIIHNKISFDLLLKIKYDLKKISNVEYISKKIEFKKIIMILYYKNKKNEK